MNKRSAFAKLIIMILCIAMLFCACDSTGKNKGEENKEDPKPATPSEQVAVSIDKTFSAIFGKGDLFDVLEDSMKTGKITIDAMGMVENVLYIDSAKGYFADELAIDIDGEKLDASIYFNAKELAVLIPMLLGDEAYGIDLENLAKDLEESEIWELLGVSYDEFMAQTDMELDQIMDVLGNAMDTLATLENALEDCLKLVEVTSEEKKVTIEGKEVDAIVVTYHFTSEDVMEMCFIMIDWAEKAIDSIMSELSKIMDEDELGDIQGSLDWDTDEIKSDIEDAFETVDLKFDADVNINKESGYLMSIEADLSGEVDGEKGKVYADLMLGVDPTESKEYTLEIGGVGADGENVGGIRLVMGREKDGNVDVTTLTGTVFEGDDEDEVFTGSLEYDTKSHDYELKVKAGGVQGDQVVITGQFEVTGDSVELSIESIDVAGESMDLDVSILIESISASELPEMPKYHNILTMSADELMELIGKLGGLGGSATNPEFDDNLFEDQYDDYYDDYYDEEDTVGELTFGPSDEQ